MPPVISNIVYTVTESTIVATWTTDISSDSNLFANGKPAIDNGYAASSTSHQAVVVGLSPQSTYSCFVKSGTTSSGTTNVMTAPSPKRTLLSQGWGSYASQPSTNAGDTFRTFVSNDNKTYITEDDGRGFGASPNTGYATQICQLTDDTAFTGGSSLLTNYQALGSTQGTDGPGGAAMTNKSTGLFGINGNLHMFVYRQFPPTYSSNRYFNIIKSTDHGATWNNFTQIGTPVAGGVVVVPQSPSEPVMLWENTLGLVSPVRYAADDGTLGYTTSGNGIDGGNAFVYCSWQDDTNGVNLYLFRVPRIAFDAQDYSAIQFWNGPSIPLVSDFVNDANWSSSPSNKTQIGTNYGWTSIDFVPTINSYLLCTYTEASVTDTTFTFYAAPTPAGPWSLIATQRNTPQGYYGAFPMHRDLTVNTSDRAVTLRMIFSGNFNISTLYRPTVQSFTFYTTKVNMLFVQKADNGLAGGGVSGTFLSNVSAKNLLIVHWRKTLPMTVTAVNDTIGNVYTIVFDSSDGGSTGGGWAYAFSKASGANTVTLTTSGGGSMNGIEIGEWSGPTNFRAASAPTSGSLANPATGTIGGSAGDLLLGFFESSQGVPNASFGAGSGFTMRNQATFSSSTYLAFQDNLSSPGGSQGTSFVATATNVTVGIGAFYTVTPAAITPAPSAQFGSKGRTESSSFVG